VTVSAAVDGTTDASSQINQLLGTYGMTAVYSGAPLEMDYLGQSFYGMWQELNAGNGFTVAQTVTPGSSFTMNRIVLPLQATTGDGADVTIGLWTDSGGNPGTLIAETVFPADFFDAPVMEIPMLTNIITGTGSMTAGSTLLTGNSTQTFQTTDPAGQPINWTAGGAFIAVVGAGEDGSTRFTTVSAYDNSEFLTLAESASVSVTNATWVFFPGTAVAWEYDIHCNVVGQLGSISLYGGIQSNGYLYVAGGDDGNNPPPNQPSTAYQRFNGITLEGWQAAPSLPTPNITAVSSGADTSLAGAGQAIAGGLWVVTGGNPSNIGTPPACYDSVFTAPIINATVGAWSTQTAFPQVVTDCASTTDGTNIWILGGNNSSVAPFYNTVYYNTVSNNQLGDTWTTTTPLPYHFNNPSAVYLNGWVMLFGGLISDTDTYPPYTFIANSGGRNGGTPTLSQWYAGPDMPYGMDTQQITTIGNNILVAGNTYGGSGPTNLVMFTNLSADGSFTPWTLLPFTNNKYDAQAMFAFANGTGAYKLYLTNSGGSTEYMGESTTAYLVPLYSIPLVAALTEGTTYHIVISSSPSPGSSSSVLMNYSYGATQHAKLLYTGLPNLQVPLQIYGSGQTGNLIHLWVDNGDKWSYLVWDSPLIDRYQTIQWLGEYDETIRSTSTLTYSGTSLVSVNQDV
jgi:hypothetical protein